MLTYAYACDRCGEFEHQQSIKDPPLGSCPQCGAAVQRLVSGGSGFVSKGGRSSFGGSCAQASSCGQRGAHCGSCHR
ncbi:MAG: zinc ribbon domain-containing protein [Deltaproteobacteria bacterium]|nr:zinc ribbon domain-containing protein [Deltaproteobacteria bacterium]